MADEFTKAALYWIKTFNKKVKEKIWMEKLLELLNEFETPHSWIVFKSYDDYDGTFYWADIDGETEIAWSDSFICSKKFWFIKWLVENKKIDIKALVVKGEMRSWWDFDNKKWNEESGEEIWNKYYSELCLMILAIQDEPIQFLVSILK